MIIVHEINDLLQVEQHSEIKKNNWALNLNIYFK